MKVAVAAALWCVLTAAAADAQPEPIRELVPPLLEDGSPPSVVYQSLDPKRTARVDVHKQVVTLAERTWTQNGDAYFRVQSLGVLDVPLKDAVDVLRNLQGYPEWVVLSPSYKSARVGSHKKLHVGIGKSDKKEAKAQAVYGIDTDGDPKLLWSARWLFRTKVRAFQPGSFIVYTLQQHPETPARTLLLQTQETKVSGLLAKKYLNGDSGNGKSRHWKDASKHARRIHWAIAVAAEGLEGSEAARQYAEYYRREFGRTPPSTSSR